MTKPARIYKADMDRVWQSLADGGHESARVTIDFAKGQIEVIIGGKGPDSRGVENWNDEDI